MGTRSSLTGALAAVALLVAGPTAADAAAVGSLPANLHLLATTGPGPIDPGVLVGFNPQPDPPGDIARVDLGDPTRPSITQPGFGSFTNLFGIHGPGGDPFTFAFPTARPPVDNVGNATFTFFASGDGRVFRATLGIEGFDGSWVGFNPQPDPPGFGGSFVGFSFAGDPKLSWCVEEGSLNVDNVFVSDGDLSFTEVSVAEPASAVLLCAGFLGLGFSRQRRQAVPV